MSGIVERLLGRASRRERAVEDRALARLEEAYELTVTALAAALELRDDETGSHARRVTELALEVARALDPELASDPGLRYGFLLHDIGKIGIPDAILLKPGRVSEQEMKQLHMHPTLGEHLVSGIPYLNGVAREVVAYHHEHWDGSGYPWGYAGEQIPLPARIFAVVDAYDAITSKRPYQAALPIATAIREISAQAGKQFDPAVVEAFIPIARRLQEAASASAERSEADDPPI